MICRSIIMVWEIWHEMEGNTQDGQAIYEENGYYQWYLHRCGIVF